MPNTTLSRRGRRGRRLTARRRQGGPGRLQRMVRRNRCSGTNNPQPRIGGCAGPEPLGRHPTPAALRFGDAWAAASPRRPHTGGAPIGIGGVPWPRPDPTIRMANILNRAEHPAQRPAHAAPNAKAREGVNRVADPLRRMVRRQSS